MESLHPDLESGRQASSTLVHRARMESKSDAMAADVQARWKASPRGTPGGERWRRWAGRAWGAAVLAATAALVVATVVAMTRAPRQQGDERRSDPLAAPRKWGPFRP